MEDQLAVLELVLIGNFNICTIWLQCDVFVFVKDLRGEHKRLTQHFCVIFEHVDEAFMNLCIIILKVREEKRMIQHHLVQGLDEIAVQELAFDYGLANKAANKSEESNHFVFVMDYGARVGIVSGAFLRLQEERIVWIEDPLAEQLKPFLGEATFVNSFFIVELDGELLFPRVELYMLELLK